MKNHVRSTYHFERNQQGVPDSVDEAWIKREIRETVNLLGIGSELVAPSDLRCIAAVLNEGFTAAQLVRFREIVDAAAAARRSRLEAMEREALVSVQTEYAKEYAKGALKELDSIQKRWAMTDAELVRLVAAAEEIMVSGLEPNSNERSGASRS